MHRSTRLSDRSMWQARVRRPGPLAICDCRERPGSIQRRPATGSTARIRTAAGYPTTEQDFKNAGRAKDQLIEHLIPADAEGIGNFVGAVISIWPQFEWRRLVEGEI